MYSEKLWFCYVLTLQMCLFSDWQQMAVEATARVSGKPRRLLRSAATWTVVSLGRCRPFGTVPIRKTDHPGLDPVDSKGSALEGAGTSGAKPIDNCNRSKFWFGFRDKNVFDSTVWNSIQLMTLWDILFYAWMWTVKISAQHCNNKSGLDVICAWIIVTLSC